MITLDDVAHRLTAHARATRHRRAVVIAGSRADGQTTAQRILHAAGLTDAVWITDAAAPERRALHATHARRLLGNEVDAVVFDLYAGLDVDAFAVVAGAIRAGGLLLLLAPGRGTWHHLDDPEQARIAVHPYTGAQVSRRYLQRFARAWEADPAVVWIEPGAPVTAPSPENAAAPAATRDELGCITAEQRAAVDAICALAHTAAPAPLVITADRGRGKSAALGLAAAALLRDGVPRILVTAPRFDAAATLFAHAQQQLPGAARARDVVRYRDARLQFVAPDAVAPGAPGDLLLVDEAAAIPVAQLLRLRAMHPRVVFASTIHGYEGSGRGFVTRFQAALDQATPGWRRLQLEQPVRWAAGDPLERLTFRALLLDAEPAAAARVADATAARCEFVAVDRAQLAADEPLLAEIFGLLVLAHYRTSPLDLRFLLDGPNLTLWIARHAGHVIGAALVAEEGGFDPSLARAVWAGARRPRGHLLAQSLAVHAGIETAPVQRFHRVVRIAIHPAAQGRGIGGALLATLIAAARDASADAIGSSFGLAAPLLRFWSRHGLHAVRIGLTKEAASGAPALMVLRPLTPAGDALYVTGRGRFLDQLPHLLADPLRDLDGSLHPLLAQRLPGDPPPPTELDPRDWRELAAYLAGRRDLELVLGPLQRLLDDGALAALTPSARPLVEAKLRGHAPWPALVARFALRGRGEAEAALRTALRPILLARGGALVGATLAELGD